MWGWLRSEVDMSKLIAFDSGSIFDGQTAGLAVEEANLQAIMCPYNQTARWEIKFHARLNG